MWSAHVISYDIWWFGRLLERKGNCESGIPWIERFWKSGKLMGLAVQNVYAMSGFIFFHSSLHSFFIMTLFTDFKNIECSKISQCGHYLNIHNWLIKMCSSLLNFCMHEEDAGMVDEQPIVVTFCEEDKKWFVKKINGCFTFLINETSMSLSCPKSVWDKMIQSRSSWEWTISERHLLDTTIVHPAALHPWRFLSTTPKHL